MNAQRHFAIATLLVGLTAGSVQAAPAPAVPLAPTAPAAAAAAPPPGAPVPGYCAFSYDRALADSTVGKAFAARMQQLTSQVQAELGPEGTTLQNDARTLQGQRATLAPADFETRAGGLNQRIQAFQQKEQLRQAELEQTRNNQLQRIVTQINPLIVAVYTTRRCAVVVDASSLIAINPAMDISADVVTQLNSRMSTITFDRERIDPNTGAPVAAAPAAAPAR
jgi:Skp family chaperone for outer membrane proteins